MSIQEQIRQTMRSHDPHVSEEVIKDYEALCINHNLNDISSLEDIFLALELSDKAQPAGPGKSWLSLLEIKKEVKQELEKLAKKKPFKTPIKVENAMAALSIETRPSPTPTKGGNQTQSLFSQDIIFGSQMTSVEIFGKEEIFRNKSQEKKVDFQESTHNLKVSNDFLNDPFKSRRQAIIKRIEKMTNIYHNHLTNKLNIQRFTGFSHLDNFMSKDLNIFCVGRITTGPTSDSLIENNVYFECYDPQSEHSQTCLLEVKTATQIQFKNGQVANTEECFFFLNQILAIEGSYNRETMTFECKYIYSETFVEEDADNQNQSSLMFTEGKFFSLMVAGGPFTLQGSFDLSPLNEFLARVLETKPNFVILLGPFLDMNNEAIKTGELKIGNSEAYLDYYHAFDLIINFINDRIDTLPNTTAIIIPSLSDVHHFYPYPQQPFASGKEYSKIRFLSNPSQICLNNDMKLGITSADVLFDVIKNSYVKNNISNKFALCLNEILNQRTFYPMYPSTIPLDAKCYENLSFDGKPDIVLYTSILPSGVKVVKNSIFVNYGTLMKPKDSGTYLTLMIATDSKKSLEERICVKMSKL